MLMSKSMPTLCNLYIFSQAGCLQSEESQQFQAIYHICKIFYKTNNSQVLTFVKSAPSMFPPAANRAGSGPEIDVWKTWEALII